MSKKLLFNFNREVIQDYTYVKYVGTIIAATNTLEKPIKSAILKGSTKYRDIDTGEVLDAFEDGRNLELVSVKMPVLTTTGKNLLSSSFQLGWINTSNGSVSSSTDKIATIDLIKVLPSTEYAITRGSGTRSIIAEFDDDENYLGYIGGDIFTTKSNTTKIRIFIDATTELIGHSLTVGANNKITYEPYKSNILTVNEVVSLRSNGSVCDELDLLTGKLTQRIDEDGGVLAQEIVKTVTLNILDQNGNKVGSVSSFNDTTHITTSSETIPPIFEGYLATKEGE